jgi:hypothetical protein
MPVVGRIISNEVNHQDKAAIALSSHDSTIIDSNFSDVVGTIGQLAALAKHATAIFEDLTGLVISVDARLDALSNRAKSLSHWGGNDDANQLEASVPTFIGDTSLSLQESQLLLPNSMPQSLREVYLSPSMNLAPPLADMDRFLTDPAQREKVVTCSRGYSDPSFFFNKWLSQQERRFNQLQEEKAAKKAGRKARKRLTQFSKTDSRRTVTTGSSQKAMSWKER